MLITFNCEQCHLIESCINLSGISGVLVNRMPGIILCIIKNNCLVIKSVALRKKLSPLSPPLMPHVYWDWNPEASMSLSAVYADWSTPGHSYGCPLCDMATGSRRGFSPLTVKPIVHHQETLDGQATSCCSSRSPTFSLRPLHHPPLLAATWLIVPLALHRHDYQIIMIHSLSGGRWGRFSVEGGSREKEHRGALTGREKVAKSAIRLQFQGGKKSHHWLNHLYNIRWFQQFHLMRKSTLSL